MDDAEEILDGVPVGDEPSAPLQRSEPSLPAKTGTPVRAQVAAVAAGSFLAGAATVGLMRRRRRRRRTAAQRIRRGPVGELVQIVGTRSVLLDVHLLGGRD